MKTKWKHVLSLILALSMVLTMAACGGSGGPNEASTAGDSEKKQETARQSSEAGTLDTTAAQETSSAGKEKNSDTYELYMNFPTFGTTPEKIEDVENYISELAREQGVNIQLVLQPCAIFNLESENNLTISSGDKIDLVLTMWSGGFNNYLKKDAIIPLDDLVETYGQDIKEVLGSQIAGGYYKDQLYGIPIAQELNIATAYNFRRDLLDEYISETGFEYDRNTVYSLEDLEAILEWTHEKHPELHLFAGTGGSTDNFSSLYAYDDLGTGTDVTGVLPLDGSKDTTILNLYETKEFEDYVYRMHDWNQKGYFAAGDATNEDGADVQMPTGNYAGWLSVSYTTDFTSGAYGYDLAAIRLTEANTTTSYLSDTAWGISSTCKNPEIAMQFLNLMYGDTRILAALKIGLEGVTYNVVDTAEDGYIQFQYLEGMTEETAPYYSPFEVWGNSAIAPNTLTVEEHNARVSQDVIAEENTKKNVVALGYRFDYSEVTAEVAALQSVISEYMGVLSYGTADPEKILAEFRGKLDTAGIDKVIKKNQEQLNAWLAEQ